MTHKLLLWIVFTVFLLLSPLGEAFAMECELSQFAPGTRDLTTCVGGFSSPEELRSTTGVIKCTSNSNYAPDLSFCSGITNPSFSLSSAEVAKDQNGYYTCTTAQGINRAIGLLDVIYTNAQTGQSCTIKSVFTKPNDWDLLTEGLPWQQGTNQPHKVVIFCDSDKGVNTAIGCIPITPSGFITKFLGLGTGIAGGIAFLLILFGGFQILTSAGNPEKLNGGRELVSAAISGLLLIIFSLFLLRLIGFSILGLPGFG